MYARGDQCNCRFQAVQRFGGWVSRDFHSQQKGWTIIQTFLERSCVVLEVRKADSGTGGHSGSLARGVLKGEGKSTWFILQPLRHLVIVESGAETQGLCWNEELHTQVLIG